MIVKDIITFKKHVTCGFNFDFELILPYIKTQERKHLKPVLGAELYTAWSTTPPATGKAKEVYELMQEASANLAMLNYSHVGVIQISDKGFHINSNANTIPAGWGEKKDLRRKLLQSGTQAIDEALEIMEANEADFPTWKTSTGYTDFTEFFVRKTQDFQKYYNIENSRLTFLKLKPHLLKVEDKFFDALLGDETVIIIKAAATEITKKALRYCQAAQVAFCLSELAYEGAFAVTPNGLVITSEELPGEKYGRLTEKELYNFHLAKQNDANEYMKKLLLHLNENPEIFAEFALKTAISTANPIHNTTSTVSF